MGSYCLFRVGEFYRTFRLSYQDGSRYPCLDRDDSKPDLLTQIAKPLSEGK